MTRSPAAELKRAASKAKAERVAARFRAGCFKAGIVQPVKEFQFHPVRKWRFDYAWPHLRVGLEVDGAIWVQGRHSRGAGILGDQEKANAAAALGWRILRTTPKSVDSAELLTDLAKALGYGIEPPLKALTPHGPLEHAGTP